MAQERKNPPDHAAAQRATARRESSLPGAGGGQCTIGRIAFRTPYKGLPNVPTAPPVRPVPAPPSPLPPMKISILDDYQDAVRKLECFELLAGHEVKVFNNTVKGAGQLGVRLSDSEALVLIRERTRINRDLLGKLPKLKLIAQTGKAGSHIDLDALHRTRRAGRRRDGRTAAAAELTWALTDGRACAGCRSTSRT